MTDPNTPPADPPTTPAPPAVPMGPVAQPQSTDNSRYWQSQHDKVQAELTQMRAAQQAPPTPPPTAPAPQVPPQTTALDYNDMGAWRAEDGSMRPEYNAAIFGTDVPSDTRDMLWQTVNQAQQIVQQQAQQQVTSVFGSAEAFTAASTWAAQNIPPHELVSLNKALDDPFLSPRALEELKQRAEAGGAFTQPQSPQGTNEPPQVPQGNATQSVDTPLVPGSPECNAYIADPKWKTDKTYHDTGKRRMAAGAGSVRPMPFG